MRTPSSWPNHLSEASPPNIIFLGAKSQNMGVRGNAHTAHSRMELQTLTQNCQRETGDTGLSVCAEEHGSHTLTCASLNNVGGWWTTLSWKQTWTDYTIHDTWAETPHACQSGYSAEKRSAGRNKLFSGAWNLGKWSRDPEKYICGFAYFRLFQQNGVSPVVIMGCTPTDLVNSRL